jgi:DNA invertase Pin-like site-specific DNA recombinase
MSDNLVKKRGVILVRVSGDDQEKTGYSMPSQIRLVREKMKNDGVEEVHEPIEDVESGRNPNSERRGLKTLMELAFNKLIDYVYIYDLDRLGRHYAETPYLMYSLKEYGVIVRDIKEEYNFNDPIQYVWVVIKCYQGHSESLKIGERTQRGKNEKFVQGKWVGSPPFGYRKNAKEKLEKIPEFEPIIYDIFITYKTLRDIKKTTLTINQKYMNKIGRLSTNQIRTILKNPAYSGRPRYGKTQIDAPELSVVPVDLFADVQSLLESKASKHKAKKSPKPESVLDSYSREYGADYVLRVVKVLRAVCPKCGSIMRSNGSKRLRRLNITVPNFQCTNTSCKHQKTVPSEKELEHLQKKHISCPTCRAVEDYNKTVALDGSIKYYCRRCGTSFQFTPSKEAEKTNERQLNREKENHSVSEQSFIAKMVIDPLNQPQHVDKARLRKAVELVLSAGFQLRKEAFDYLSEIATVRDPLKIVEEAIRRLGELQKKPLFIERSHLNL